MNNLCISIVNASKSNPVLPFGVLQYLMTRTTLEHSVVNYFLFVHCKKKLQLLAWISTVRIKKERISIT
jgi:hypothetical protein